jgi:hypothetical protein
MLPTGVVFQTSLYLTWVWLEAVSLYRLYQFYVSGHGGAEPFLFFVPA